MWSLECCTFLIFPENKTCLSKCFSVWTTYKVTYMGEFDLENKAKLNKWWISSFFQHIYWAFQVTSTDNKRKEIQNWFSDFQDLDKYKMLPWDSPFSSQESWDHHQSNLDGYEFSAVLDDVHCDLGYTMSIDWLVGQGWRWSNVQQRISTSPPVVEASPTLLGSFNHLSIIVFRFLAFSWSQ